MGGWGIKNNQLGEGPTRSWAKAEQRKPSRKPSPRGAETLKICTRFFLDTEALSRELRHNPKRGSGASRFLRSLTQEVRPEKWATDCGWILVKGWSVHPVGPQEKLRRWLWMEGAVP